MPIIPHPSIVSAAATIPIPTCITLGFASTASNPDHVTLPTSPAEQEPIFHTLVNAITTKPTVTPGPNSAGGNAEVFWGIGQPGSSEPIFHTLASWDRAVEAARVREDEEDEEVRLA